MQKKVSRRRTVKKLVLCVFVCNGGRLRQPADKTKCMFLTVGNGKKHLVG